MEERILRKTIMTSTLNGVNTREISILIVLMQQVCRMQNKEKQQFY